MKKKIRRITKISKLIKISEIMDDMSKDLSDEDILKKYQIGWKQLSKIYEKLFHGNFLTEQHMRRRIALRHGKKSSHIPFAEITNESRFYECLLCGFISRLHFSTCPRCGYINLRRLKSRTNLFHQQPTNARSY